MKKVLITGITGQTGSYMADLLLEKGYEVHGMIRRSATDNTSNISHIIDKITLHFGDMSDSDAIRNIVSKVLPDEVYNFAAMSDVRVSYDEPVYTGDITALGFARILEAIRAIKPDTKIYQAGSSEMFGKVQETPQKESTPFWPRSPYGCAKAYAFHLGRSYREGYKMKIYNGILFNHESPRRGSKFLSKKVVKAAVRIKKGLQEVLELGNLDAKRDWGSAKDYAYWIWKMVQGEPGDYVIATGETHSVQEFVETVFKRLDLDPTRHVIINQDLFRPAEVDLLLGDSSKAQQELGYEIKTAFSDLIDWMIEDELKQYA